jgi:bifunctional non-homologous end joining protein LigD
LFTRNHLSLDERYPQIVRAVAAQGADFVVDGEIAVTVKGRTTFGGLQQKVEQGGGARARASLNFHVFDVIHMEGRDTTGLDLVTRKSVLDLYLDKVPHLKLVSYRRRNGEKYLEEACAKGWEGLIAKRADSTYEHGRSKEWLKFKCSNEQEFVIGGYTDPQGERTQFGALLVGFYDHGKLLYAGKVGTGFNAATLRSILAQMAPLETEVSPFDGPPPLKKNVHWVRPELVAQVGFSEWTGDHRLRHPRFVGMRDDKDPRKVVRENPS